MMKVRIQGQRRGSELAGKTGEVLGTTAKYAQVLLDEDVREAGAMMIRRKDIDAFMRGETVKNMLGEDFRNEIPAGDLGVSFFQEAEDWAVRVPLTAIEEV